MSEQFVPLRGNKRKPNTHTQKIKLLWWQQRKAKLPTPDACLLYNTMHIHTPGACLLWCTSAPMSWHSVAPSSHFYGLTYLLRPEHCPVTVLGHFETAVQVQVITLQISCSGAKRSKNREVKTKNLTGLWFALSLTSASYWEPASLFPQNALCAYMTELRYSVFERQNLSHPK